MIHHEEQSLDVNYKEKKISLVRILKTDNTSYNLIPRLVYDDSLLRSNLIIRSRSFGLTKCYVSDVILVFKSSLTVNLTESEVVSHYIIFQVLLILVISLLYLVDLV